MTEITKRCRSRGLGLNRKLWYRLA